LQEKQDSAGISAQAIIYSCLQMNVVSMWITSNFLTFIILCILSWYCCTASLSVVKWTLQMLVINWLIVLMQVLWVRLQHLLSVRLMCRRRFFCFIDYDAIYCYCLSSVEILKLELKLN